MAYNDLQIGMLAIGVIKLVTCLTFLGLYVVRINKLDKMASNTLQKDRSLKFRIGGVGMLIFLNTIHIILSFSDPYYFMYPFANFSLVSILEILDLILQIYIITRQHKKKTRRSRSVLIFWILMAIQQISTIVIVQVLAKNIGVILQIFKLIITMVLIVLTLIIQPPQPTNLQNFHQNTKQSNLLPILSSTVTVYTRSNDNIYIQFNKQFQVSIGKENYQFQFKIAVYVGGKFHIVTKSQNQFAQLSKDMGQLFSNSQAVLLLNITKKKNVTNITKYGEQKLKIYQQYLFNLTKTNQFYAEPLMNFLQIPAFQRAELQKHKGCILKKNTMNSSDQEQKNTKKPFFTVSWKDGKVYISNPQILDLFVNKSKYQMIAFHNKLIIQKRLTFELLSQTPDQNQLLHFMYRVVNCKSLWKNFAEWMCLGTAIQQKIYNMFDFWNNGFEDLQISVIGHETSFDKNKSVIYLYLISIQNKNTHQQAIVLKKRFSDFLKLDQNIRKFVISQNIKNVNIPLLPPRYSPFQNKTSPNSRRVYFDGYLKNMIKIQGINYCIKLLEFFQMDTQILEYSSESKDKKPRQNSQIFDNIQVQVLELEK